MDKNLYIQIYSVRDKMQTPESVESTLKALASYGYKGFQTAGNIKVDAERYPKLLKETGLKVIGTHTALETLEDADAAAEYHAKLETNYAGVGAMPGIFSPNFTKEDFRTAVDKMHSVVENLAKKNLIFTYHHHSSEFAKIGNETMMDIMVREFANENFTFCLDTYWLVHAGVEIREWLEKLAGKVHILHLKDKGIPFAINDATITELGNGNINFKEVIKIAQATGVKHLCYEQDNGFAVDCLDSAKKSAEYFYSII